MSLNTRKGTVKKLSVLEKEILVGLGGKNAKHFESLGYKIPKTRNMHGKMITQIGTKILVRIEDLPKSSNVKVTKVCDLPDCQKIIPNQSYSIILKRRESGDGKDRCFECGQYKRGFNQKNNISYEKSLEYFALNNNKEYLLLEFSYKNNKIPKDISFGSDQICLWKCPKCKNEYDMKVCSRTSKNNNCPYCGIPIKRIKIGFNDLWTTHPHIAKLLKNPQRGYELTVGSNILEYFKCDKCGFEQIKQIKNLINQGRFLCTKCSDGISYPEKFIFNLLEQLNIKFETQKTFNWSNSKKYDFYLPDLNCIVETHGEQHFNDKNNFNKLSRSFKEEKENDEYKMELAKINKIVKYIVLDCRQSNLEFIKISIFNSSFNQMFNLKSIDWLKCHEFSCNTLVKTVCDLWNNGMENTLEISKLVKLDRLTVTRYLKQGNLLKWCSYNPKEEMKKSNGKNGKNTAKPVVQLSMNGKYITTWESATEVKKILGISFNNISAACLGKRKYSHGFKWMFLKDYEKLKGEM